MSKLVIVESPAKAKTIGKYLGPDYVVKASMGHVRDLPKKKMSVDIEHDFTPNYMPIEGKEKIIAELRQSAAESDFVYLATDPDREGEAISWHLKYLLNLKDDRCKRVTFNEITPKAVRYGIEHPRDIDLDLVDAQQARRILDRIVGYQLSPFLWRKVKRGLSAGRVQSVATRLVVDRENEIRAFVPEEYWTIEATLRTTESGQFTARYYGDAAGKRDLKTGEEAQVIVDAVTGKPFTVGAIKRGKKRKSAAPPFTTSTMQQEASRKLGMVPRRTMSVAQELYEGIELEGYGMTGLITYMRTDSLRLSDDATAAAASFIRGKYGEAFYPGKPRVFRTKNGAQDAHEAIRPSNVELEPDAIRPSLTADQYKLYKLIWSRFVACQMADAVLDTISADLLCADHVFRASGHTVAFPGFTAVYEESTDDDKKNEAGKPLPRFNEGDSLTGEKIEPAQHFTQPPARYTEASLIRAMEERGIGRPSTYAPTIATIIDRDYVSKENRALRPTPLGEGVTGLLVDKFKSVADYEFTANMEESLDEVEAGKVNYKDLLRSFYGGFESALEQAKKDMEKTRIKIKDEETDIPCEKCGRKLVIKNGRFGKFLACPGFPECTFTKAITEDTGAACPNCGAKVVKKKSARGYVYFSCDKFPACQFMTWDKPLKTKCPQCDSSLFRHTDRDSKEITDVCLREGCGYSELVRPGVSPEEAEKNRLRREARAAKAAEAAAKKAAGEEESAPKAPAKKTPAKKTAKKKEPLPWMTKTTNRFKKLKPEEVEALTAKQQEQYAKALAKDQAAKEAEKAKKAAEKAAAKEAEKAKKAAEKAAAKEAEKKKKAAEKAAAKKKADAAKKKAAAKKTAARKTAAKKAAKKTEGAE